MTGSPSVDTAHKLESGIRAIDVTVLRALSARIALYERLHERPVAVGSQNLARQTRHGIDNLVPEYVRYRAIEGSVS